MKIIALKENNFVNDDKNYKTITKLLLEHLTDESLKEEISATNNLEEKIMKFYLVMYPITIPTQIIQ